MRSVKIFLTFLFIFMAFTGLPLDIYFFFHTTSNTSYYANIKLMFIKSVSSLLSALFVILILEEDQESTCIKISKVTAGKFLALAIFFNIFFFMTSYSIFAINIFSIPPYDIHYFTYLWVFAFIVYFLSLLFHKRIYKKFKKIMGKAFPIRKNIEEAGVKA